jgi:hypothetical protein
MQGIPISVPSPERRQQEAGHRGTDQGARHERGVARSGRGRGLHKVAATTRNPAATTVGREPAKNTVITDTYYAFFVNVQCRSDVEAFAEMRCGELQIAADLGIERHVEPLRGAAAKDKMSPGGPESKPVGRNPDGHIYGHNARRKLSTRALRDSEVRERNGGQGRD